MPESRLGDNFAARIESQTVEQTTRIETVAAQLKSWREELLQSRSRPFLIMFNPIISHASPTPSPVKDFLSAKWSRKGRGMSAPCPTGCPRPCPVRVPASVRAVSALMAAKVPGQSTGWPSQVRKMSANSPQSIMCRRSSRQCIARLIRLRSTLHPPPGSGSFASMIPRRR
jgi:hypothetical protein